MKLADEKDTLKQSSFDFYHSSVPMALPDATRTSHPTDLPQ
ncbi:MAG: hypothetical protein ABL974_23725 [Prosthecobacter sp.]